MSERFWAEIMIPTLALQVAEVASNGELYEDRQDYEDGTTVINAPEVCWGKFDMEDVLVKLGIPFDRQTEGKYEYDPERRHFRPGKRGLCGLFWRGCDTVVTTTQDGDLSFTLETLEALAHKGQISLRQLKKSLNLPRTTVAEWARTHKAYLKRLIAKDPTPAEEDDRSEGEAAG